MYIRKKIYSYIYFLHRCLVIITNINHLDFNKCKNNKKNENALQATINNHKFKKKRKFKF